MDLVEDVMSLQHEDQDTVQVIKIAVDGVLVVAPPTFRGGRTMTFEWRTSLLLAFQYTSHVCVSRVRASFRTSRSLRGPLGEKHDFLSELGHCRS